jgi:hypothetical protein
VIENQEVPTETLKQKEGYNHVRNACKTGVRTENEGNAKNNKEIGIARHKTSKLLPLSCCPTLPRKLLTAAQSK